LSLVGVSCGQDEATSVSALGSTSTPTTAPGESETVGSQDDGADIEGPVLQTCRLAEEMPEGIPDDLKVMPAVPAVTVPSADEIDALAIARTDPLLKAALESPGAEIAWATPWFGMSDDDRLGVELHLEFQEPVALSPARGVPAQPLTPEGRVPHGPDGYPLLSPLDARFVSEYDRALSAQVMIRLDTATIYSIVAGDENQMCRP